MGYDWPAVKEMQGASGGARERERDFSLLRWDPLALLRSRAQFHVIEYSSI